MYIHWPCKAQKQEHYNSLSNSPHLCTGASLTQQTIHTQTVCLSSIPTSQRPQNTFTCNQPLTIPLVLGHAFLAPSQLNQCFNTACHPHPTTLWQLGVSFHYWVPKVSGSGCEHLRVVLSQTPATSNWRHMKEVETGPSGGTQWLPDCHPPKSFAHCSSLLR